MKRARRSQPPLPPALRRCTRQSGMQGTRNRGSQKIEMDSIDTTVEENLFAMLDTQGVKEAEDIEEDKLSFLEAVYAECVVGGNGNKQSRKIYQAVYSALQESQSIEVAMASYRLLKDLERASYHASVNDNALELPIGTSILDSDDIGLIVEKLVKDYKDLSVRFVAKVLSFECLVGLLQSDFQRCLKLSTKDDNVLEESYFQRQLKGGQKRFKDLTKNLLTLSIMPAATVETQKEEILCSDILTASIQAFISMVFEMDAHCGPYQSSSVDALLDAIHYSQQLLPSLLQVIQRPEHKLQFIYRYFSKHVPKAKKIMGDFSCLESILRSFEDDRTALSLIKAIDEEPLQLLLSHGFQAFLQCKTDKDVSTHARLLVTAFKVLSEVELHPFAKQALILAEALCSKKDI